MIIILSACVSVSLVMSLAFCLCWRRKTPNDDWQGLDGMVTQKNPDENVNHLPQELPTASCVVDGLNASGDSLDSNKRSTLTTKRSLPDIPSEQAAAISWEPTGDNSSEHYATVGQYQNSVKRHTIANGVEARPSISQHSSISQADDTFSPYERVKYDKIKSKEHPYAQVQPTTSRPIVYEEAPSTVEERVNLLSGRVDAAGPSTDPTAPTRSRRSSAHSSGGLEIPASAAVAGALAASPELPYMTPPVTQANFSGDSQDSSKGYTSISVREPLANIKAQTKELTTNRREIDPHYASVSDDSDDVYTTIPDPNNPIYTSESETYARIPPLPITVEAEVNHPPSSRRQQEPERDEQLYEPPPQPTPPSVNSLKQVASHTHSHSRQASSSSSIANLGSPKPEKRQANSPLPPPPLTQFDFHADKAQLVRNLDDLYAKVHKTKKEDTNGEQSPEKGESLRSSVSSNKSVQEEKVAEKRAEHNYETLKKQRQASDPGYEKIRCNDEPGYASINGPESITSSSDPGYEVLKNRTPSEVDPNYEQLRHKTSNVSDSGYSRIKEINHGYSVVNKKKNAPLATFGNASDEPNYESMPNEEGYIGGSDTDPNYESVSQTDPNYESVSQTDPNYESVSQTDPNYESVSQTDPNYESVKDLELPYERLDEDSGRNNSDYEKVNGKNSDSSKTESEPPYEQLNNDTDSDMPGYEKISKVKSQSSGSSGNSVEPIQSDVMGNIHDEDAIFEV